MVNLNLKHIHKLVATAYHWLDSTVRVTKVAQARRHHGVLVVVEPTTCSAATRGVSVDVQESHVRWDPSTTPRQPAARHSTVGCTDMNPAEARVCREHLADADAAGSFFLAGTAIGHRRQVRLKLGCGRGDDVGSFDAVVLHSLSASAEPLPTRFHPCWRERS